jgi:glycosyltransferase involved in cell wall biosynthesis
VIATRESPLPQLLAGGGLFIEPGNLDVLTAALVQLSDMGLRRTLGAEARRQALALSWTRCAQATLAALREAAG